MVAENNSSVESLRQVHRDLTRSRIRDAARDLFFDRHYDLTTMGEIALSAGVRRQTLYLHYKDKPEILSDIIANWMPKAKTFMSTLPEVPLNEVIVDRNAGSASSIRMRWTICP